MLIPNCIQNLIKEELKNILNYPTDESSFLKNLIYHPDDIQVIFNNNYMAKDLVGHFQSNIAFTLGKKNKESSAIVIASLIEKKFSLPYLNCFVSGNGFLNFNVLSHHILYDIIDNPFLHIKEKQVLVLDFGGPNIAKPLHIGHIRSLLIGESLRRLYIYLGYQVISDIHLGDCGTQMGMIALGFQKDFPDSPFLHNEPFQPHALPFDINYLSNIYSKMSEICQQEPTLLFEARKITRMLQEGSHLGWNKFFGLVKELSIKHIKEITSVLEVQFDLWMGESDVLPLIPEILANGVKQGKIISDQGCLVIPLKKVNFLLQKNDQSYLYSTTDLATLKWRVETFNPSHIIYVADKRQSLHFSQVFEAANILKLVAQTKLSHVGFGTVNRPDGKPFKTREGGTLDLAQIIGEVMHHSRVQGNSNSDIGLSTIKFAILAPRSTSDYIYKVEDFTRRDGKTGTYIMYTYARLTSVTLKIKERAKSIVIEEEDNVSSLALDVILNLSMFSFYLKKAHDEQDTSFMCEYAFNVSQSFNRFYQDETILSHKVRRSHLKLLDKTETILGKVMDIIGLHKSKDYM